MLQCLGIEEYEIDDLIFEDETDTPKEGIKWMALARVRKTNYFRPQTFEHHMRVVWSPAKEVKINPIQKNLFTIQCFCRGDWLKVKDEGPWLFRQNAVIIEPYDGLGSPESIDLNSIAIWIQIHKLPIGYRTKALINVRN
jgi:1,4-dihydroxy-2-naphthoyl-CoA synthase